MKVKDLIEQLQQYNQEVDVFVNSRNRHIGFTLAYGGSDGVEKENCETVSIYPDDLGTENTIYESAGLVKKDSQQSQQGKLEELEEWVKEQTILMMEDDATMHPAVDSNNLLSKIQELKK